MKKQESFLFSSLVIIIFYVLNRILNMGRGIILARTLGTEGYGYYNMAFFFVGLMIPIISLGTTSAYLRYVPTYTSQKKLRFLVKQIHMGVIFLSVIFALIIFIFRKKISIFIFEEYIPGYMYVIIFLMVFSVLLDAILNLWAGMKKFLYKSLLRFSVDFVWLVTIIFVIFLYGKITVNKVLFLYLIVLFIIVILSEMYLWKKYIPYDNDTEDKKIFWKKIFSFSIWFAIVPILYQLFRYTDRLVITHIMSMSDVGIYSVAANISMLLFGLGRSLNSIINPRLSFYWDKQDKDRVYNLFSVYLKIISITMVVLSFIVILFKSFIVSFLYGEEYVQAVEVISYLLVFGAFNVLGYAMGIYLSIIEKTMFYILPAVISLLFNIVLNIYFIPIMGIKGAGLATMITYFISFLTTLIIVLRFGFRLTKKTYLLLFYPFILLLPLKCILVTFMVLPFLFTKKDIQILNRYILQRG